MFWIFDWLREFGFDSDEKIMRALQDRKVYRNLRETARVVGSRKAFELKNLALVAGAGIDLTGAGVCMNPDCIREQVDDLVRHVWHYFDKVAITDLTPSIARLSHKYANIPILVAWLQSLLFLESIGAADMLEFVEGPSFCGECMTTHASDYGLEEIVTNFDDIVDEIVEQSELVKTQIGDGTYVEVSLNLSFVENQAWRGRMAATYVKRRGDKQVKRELATSLLRRSYDLLFNGLGTADVVNAPLGTTGQMQHFLLRRTNRDGATREQVIFNLDLPILDSVPLKELIKIRKHEAALFNVFQDNLRMAVDQTIKELGSNDIVALTKRVREEIIDPDLHQIRYALEKNSSALKRTWGMAAVGASVVTVGSLATGHDPVFAAGASAIVAAAGWAHTVLTARDDVTKSKMYFLFAATRTAHQHQDTPRSFDFLH